MEILNIDVVNDQHIYSGTYTHAEKIHENFLNHNYNSKFYQFSISEPINTLPSGTVLKKGFLFNIGRGNKLIYNSKLALNFLTGKNWKSLKGLNGDVQIFSGPTLLPLTGLYPNNIVIGHDLYFLDHNGRIIESLYWKKMYKKFKKAKIIMVNSNFTKNEFIKKLGIDESKIFTVYPYVNRSIFFPRVSNIKIISGVKSEDKLLLSVGGDNPNKNIETILRLIKKLPENYKLIRVGRNFHTLKLVKDLGLNNRIINISNVDIETLSEIYRCVDIFIFPSLFEGFGIPVIEAMASGLPVITSNVTSLPEVIGDAGVLCDPYDIDCMIDAVMKITRDETLKIEFAKKGLRRIEIFSSESQFRSINNIFRALNVL
ncbi:MAG: glycosyltransferase family 4 protein [Caldisphaera sp.]